MIDPYSTINTESTLVVYVSGKRRRRRQTTLIGAEQEHKSKSDILYPIGSWILRVRGH